MLNYGERRIGDTQVELLLGADRGKLPRLDLSALSDAELYRELGRRRRAKRKVHRGGTGRPPKPRLGGARSSPWTSVLPF